MADFGEQAVDHTLLLRHDVAEFVERGFLMLERISSSTMAWVMRSCPRLQRVQKVQDQTKAQGWRSDQPFLVLGSKELAGRSWQCVKRGLT